MIVGGASSQKSEAAVDDDKADQAFQRVMRRERFGWIKDELRGIALLAAIILIIAGALHLLGIEDPTFTEDDDREIGGAR